MIRVFSVNPNRLESDLLKSILNVESDMRVVGVATHESEALRQIGSYDIAIVHAALPAGGALKLTKWLGRSPESPSVIVFGLSDDDAALNFLEAGAAGCVRSAGDLTELLDAIRRVARHEIALPTSLLGKVRGRVSDLAERCRNLGGELDRSFNQRALTQREREILRLMAQGCGNREIAQQLTIELGTAKNHVHNILDKLSVSSRRDAAACWSLAAQQL